MYDTYCICSGKQLFSFFMLQWRCNHPGVLIICQKKRSSGLGSAMFSGNCPLCLQCCSISKCVLFAKHGCCLWCANVSCVASRMTKPGGCPEALAPRRASRAHTLLRFWLCIGGPKKRMIKQSCLSPVLQYKRYIFCVIGTAGDSGAPCEDAVRFISLQMTGNPLPVNSTLN